MPSVKQSQNVSMTGWQPNPPNTADSSPTTFQPANEVPLEQGNQNMNPFMLSSMPLMAATNDALNQFYGNWSIPQFRTVPMQHGGNS